MRSMRSVKKEMLYYKKTKNCIGFEKLVFEEYFRNQFF